VNDVTDPSQRRRTLLYLGGIDLPMPQARAVQTLHTAHALASLGWRVVVAVGQAPRERLGQVLADYGLAPHPNLKVLALPTLRLPRLPIAAYVHPRLAAWNWSYGLAAMLACRLLPPGWRPRLVLARDPRLAWLFLAARAWTGAEVVYEVHELFSTRAREPVAEAGASPPTRTPRVRGLEAAVFGRALGLVALTGACRALLLEEFGLQPERVIAAPDAVARRPERLPPRSTDGRTVVYAGQLYPWKGVGTLVRALPLLPEARLEIVGGLADGDPHQAALRALAQQLGVERQIDFVGYLPHARVAEAIARGAAAVVPLPDNPMARFFTSPLKLFEYMAAGLPIVASDLPALAEVLVDGRNALLVPPDDPAALAAALRRLLADPALAERLRSQAFADVADHTWAARAATVSAALERWAGQRPA
jgi:glycosyltransferase involved in cell wall biosynthesis